MLSKSCKDSSMRTMLAILRRLWLHLTKIGWVPEELNLSTPAALFDSRPGYSRLSGKGPVLAVRFERTLERVLGSPPLPLGYASVVPSAGFEPALSAF
jgi:hypothetical protein